MEKIPRAFLSHDSADKSLVRRVAEDLGRAAVVYDEFEFKTGEDFKTAIQQGLDRSEVFVLFASKSALKKEWVRFEIDEAEKAQVARSLVKVLTYLIDDDIKLSDLPEWMLNTRVERQGKAGLISLDIQRVLFGRLSQRSKTYFVGRQTEIENALEIIASHVQEGITPPIIIYGLNGIGRKSLLSAVARDHLSYEKLLTIDLKEGDLLSEMYLKLVQKISPDAVGNPDEFLKKHEVLSKEIIISNIIEAMRSACQSQALPVIRDFDALSNYEGNLHTDFALLFDAIAQSNLDMGCITNRRMYIAGGAKLRSLRVEELSVSHMQNLIRLVGKDKK